MTWYGVAAIMAFRVQTTEPSMIDVHENVYLIDAQDVEDAEKIATERATLEVAANDDLKYGTAPVKLEFVGIRKVTKIFNESPFTANDAPASGSEISYSIYRVRNDADLKKLGSGEKVWIEYIDDSE